MKYRSKNELFREGVNRDREQLDGLDEKILWELIRDGRVSFTKLAMRMNLAVSTVSARVSALKRSGVITSTHAEIDYKMLGFPVQAMVFVKLRLQTHVHIESYAEEIAKLPSLLNLYFLGSTDDFLIHVLCTSSDQLRDVVSTQISASELVVSTRTHVIFDYSLAYKHMGHLTGFDDLRRPILPVI